MPKIVTVEQMRAIEQASDKKGHTYADMMELAGRAVAERVQVLLAGRPEPRVAVLVGPGNNGGDGLVAARVLAQAIDNANVGAFLMTARGADDPVFSAARDAGVFIATAADDQAGGFRVLQNLVGNADVVIDALFGTSLRLPIKGDAAKVLQAAARALVVRRAERPRAAYITPAEPGENWAVKVLRKEIDGSSALLLGPGWGREPVTGDFLRELLQPKEEIRRSRAIGFVPIAPQEEDVPGAELPPLVIDADGLNLLASFEDWPGLVPPGTILTPHPGEFARLTGLEIAEVQANRLALAGEKAAAWGCTVVLKGAFTVVAAPDGRIAVLPFASAALASAGTGDVLAGAIVGLRAQGLQPFEAELLETTASVTAGDVLELLPEAVAQAERSRR